MFARWLRPERWDQDLACSGAELRHSSQDETGQQPPAANSINKQQGLCIPFHSRTAGESLEASRRPRTMVTRLDCHLLYIQTRRLQAEI